MARLGAQLNSAEKARFAFMSEVRDPRDSRRLEVIFALERANGERYRSGLLDVHENENADLCEALGLLG